MKTAVVSMVLCFVAVSVNTDVSIHLDVHAGDSQTNASKTLSSGIHTPPYDTLSTTDSTVAAEDVAMVNDATESLLMNISDDNSAKSNPISGVATSTPSIGVNQRNQSTVTQMLINSEQLASPFPQTTEVKVEAILESPTTNGPVIAKASENTSHKNNPTIGETTVKSQVSTNVPSATLAIPTMAANIATGSIKPKQKETKTLPDKRNKNDTSAKTEQSTTSTKKIQHSTATLKPTDMTLKTTVATPNLSSTTETTISPLKSHVTPKVRSNPNTTSTVYSSLPMINSTPNAKQDLKTSPTAESVSTPNATSTLNTSRVLKAKSTAAQQATPASNNSHVLKSASASKSGVAVKPTPAPNTTLVQTTTSALTFNASQQQMATKVNLDSNLTVSTSTSGPSPKTKTPKAGQHLKKPISATASSPVPNLKDVASSVAVPSPRKAVPLNVSASKESQDKDVAGVHSPAGKHITPQNAAKPLKQKMKNNRKSGTSKGKSESLVTIKAGHIKVTLQEATVLAIRQFFNRLDLNHDGVVDQHEHQVTWTKADVNGDGVLSKDEIHKTLTWYEALALDLDGDGIPTRREMKRFTSAVDFNGDGAIDISELIVFIGLVKGDNSAHHNY